MNLYIQGLGNLVTLKVIDVDPAEFNKCIRSL